MAYTATILFAIVVVYLPWQMYIYQTFPKEANFESQYNFRHFTEVIEQHGGDIFWHLLYMPKIWNELIYVVLIWFGYTAMKQYRDANMYALMVWLIVPYLFFSMAMTKMIAYPILTAPAVFTIEAMFCAAMLAQKGKYQWVQQFLVVAMIVIAARYAYERVRPFNAQTKATQKAQFIKSWKTTLSQHDKNIIFNTDDYCECMFYHNDCTAYPFAPKKSDVDSLSKIGYTIFTVEKMNNDSMRLIELK